MSFGIVSFGVMSFSIMSFPVMSFGLLSDVGVSQKRVNNFMTLSLNIANFSCVLHSAKKYVNKTDP